MWDQHISNILMFKIVETLEKGSKKLTIVPSGWETNGQLAWPKFCTERIIQNPDSLPEDSWFRMTCKLKRNHLLNYDIAEEEMERMLDRSDTEQEETFFTKKKRFRSMAKKDYVPSSEDDFNAMALNACTVPPVSILPENENPSIKIISQEIIKESDTFENAKVIYLSEDFTTSSNNGQNLTEIDKFDHLENKLNEVLVNQAIIIDNQKLIMDKLENSGGPSSDQMVQELARLAAMMDTIGSKLTYNKKNIHNKENEKETSDICIEPINSLVDLQQLEKKIINKEVMDDYVEKLGFVCGRKGNGNGINNSYILIDRIFTRKFMTLCSWAGGARDKKEKIPFKIFKNVISLFFNVVSMSDTSFTLVDCEVFFKNVIRNSTRRSQSAGIRTSSMKRRPKNLLYSEKGKNALEDIGNNDNNSNNGNKNVNLKEEDNKEENGEEN